MKRVFDFIESLNSCVFEILGYPTIKFGRDYCEVHFDVVNTIRDLRIFDVKSCDEFRMFSSESTPGSITCIFRFYLLPFVEE